MDSCLTLNIFSVGIWTVRDILILNVKKNYILRDLHKYAVSEILIQFG